MLRYSRLLFASLAVVLTPLSFASLVFINEFHYDNAGTDTGEFIEVAGLAGTNLDGYSIALYNGSNGTTYNTLDLSVGGIIQDQQNGFGTFHIELPSDGIQNGAPDGFALIDNDGFVLQFLSYEGAFSAASGPAAGLTSVDVGVFESGNSPIAVSLQLNGTGNTAEDFTWTFPDAETPGGINNFQNFVPVPLPATLWVFLSALFGLIAYRKKPTLNGVGSAPVY